MNKLELLEIAAINNDYNNFISFLERGCKKINSF